MEKSIGFMWAFSGVSFESIGKQSSERSYKMCFNSLMLCNPERCISIGLTCMLNMDLGRQLIASCCEMTLADHCSNLLVPG